MKIQRAADSSRIRCGLVALVSAITLPSTPALAQQTWRTSVDSSGAEGNGESGGALFSADGNVIAFTSDASNLVAGDTNGTWDVFVHDRTTGITERVSVDSTGVEANDMSYDIALSSDGRFVAFLSWASNLVAGDTNGNSDIFVRDRTIGTTERVSVDSAGGESNGGSFEPSISADGRYVAFMSVGSNLVPGDQNHWDDIFVHDRTTGVTERVSVSSAGGEAESSSGYSKITPDGRFVAFDSGASNLVAGDGNLTYDVFVHDRSTGITERVSVTTAGTEGNGPSGTPTISDDGRFVAFDSWATDLVANDTNGVGDAFVHDRSTGTTERVDVDSSGTEGDGGGDYPAISASGQFVAFESRSTNMVANDTNGSTDIFVRDRTFGITTRVSVDSNGAEGDNGSDVASISSDGLSVGFNSDATNLVAGDTNGALDAFVHEICSTPASWANYGAGFPGTLGVPSFTSQNEPSLGASVTVDVANSLGAPTVGLLLLGFTAQDLHSTLGGDLLVVPALVEPIAFASGPVSFTGTIPFDPRLGGTTIDLQVLEADAGAAKGVSFTQGLELTVGR